MAEENKKSKKDSKNTRRFFKDFKAELKKVIWPTPKQLMNNTIAVITIVLITSVVVFVLDLTFKTFSEQGVGRLRHYVETKIEEPKEITPDQENSEDMENNEEDIPVDGKKNEE